MKPFAYRHGLADTSQIVRATDDRDWSSDLNPLKKQSSEISRHPHASVGRRVSWEVSGVHPNCRAEFHEVRHRRGSIMATPR
jgi:hypothetical protein